ncbi:H-type lectin domain-containing protein [Crassaminicella profunda]|uniref:H-type lectin domain-containing protein n=1 Tax=Crassaminicella profunda TaxID=1286698 RepID=UPI001CA7B3B5|nr:H-type lectin domain-containing protein [Crassaminicella profunda]QZY55097.1 H-type lectin domain-containing protein [Crassaminicella profunda]
MATETKNLKLCKKNPETDGNEYFDIKTMLNDNWDKVDQGIEDDRDRITQIEEKAMMQQTEITKLNNEVINKLERTVKTLNYPSIIEHFETNVAGNVDVSMEGRMVVNYYCNKVAINDMYARNQAEQGSTTIYAPDLTQSASDIIPVIAGEKYTIIFQFSSEWLRGLFLDSDKKVIADGGYWGGAYKKVLIIAPQGASYFIFSNEKENMKTAMFLKGDYTNIDVPYVESAQPLEHPYVKLCGENLFDKDNSFGYFYVGSDGSLVENANQNAFRVLVKANTDYYIKNYGTYGGLGTNIRYEDSTGNLVCDENWTILNKHKFTTPIDAKYMVFNINTDSLVTGGRIFQINKGTTLLPYNPYKEALAILPTYLAKIPNTSYKDVWKGIKGTKGIVDRRVGRIKLDNTFDYEVRSNEEGYKRINVLSFIKSKNILESSLNGVFKKYNGKILKIFDSVYEIDTYSSEHDDKTLVIAVSNTDTGWGDSYTPTTDEIKAYIMGWKMYDAEVGSSQPYNRTDGLHKAWVRIIKRESNNWTKTCPTQSYPEWNGYELFYALAESYEEEIELDIPFGKEGLTAVEGMNTVEVGSGLAYEKARLVLNSVTVSDYVCINPYHHVSYPDDSPHLEYKVKTFLAVFKVKNGETSDDTSNWVKHTNKAYGNERYGRHIEKHDEQAEYYVLYEMLDEEYNNQLANAQVKYEENMRESHKKLVEEVGEVEGDIAGINKEIEDTLIKGNGEKIQKGTAQVTIEKANLGKAIDVIFNKSFSEIPTITTSIAVSTNNGGYLSATVAQVTRTGFTIYVCSYIAQIMDIDWIAIGK